MTAEDGRSRYERGRGAGSKNRFLQSVSGGRVVAAH